METHEIQRDYWRLMRTNGDLLDSERLMKTHETNGES